MTFKEQIQRDLENVFFNLDEIAETHRIEGQPVVCMIDDDELSRRKREQVPDMVDADMLIFARAADMPKDLSPGRLLNVDGREMLVTKSSYDTGLVTVTLRQNRSA